VALTEDEVTLVNLAFFEGPSALVEAGMTPESVRVFFERDDIQAELGLLKRELDHHDALKARAKFFVRRSLHRLIDPATAVLTMALAGPQYSRDKDGVVQRDSRGNFMVKQPEVTKVQVAAAKTVISGVGLNDFRIASDPGSDNQLDVLFRQREEARTVDYEMLGQTEEERILSRERIRTAISKLAPRLPAAREEFREQFSETMANGSGPTRKRKAKKKATKKATTTKKKVTAKKKATRKPARKRSDRGST
jgi:hypothetical protein